ncbi:hypothetical protein M9Y10_012308 [Tritrichomonas musculus]|uniref:Dolichyl-phosphate-mannose--protein mannosyltransferase n=1 Tax=Tritrichomonas musculus TaxID=1915356 RepID=A0ABR2IC69_9EUKA
MLYDYQYTKGACYSDIPFHTNIIMSCIMGCNSKVKLNGKKAKLMSVFFSGEPLAYSMIPDWYSASLMLSGFTSIRYALLIPSIFVTFSLITSFYSLSYFYSKSHFISSLSLFLLFNLGGSSWTHILEFTYSRFTNRKYSNENIFDFILTNFDFTIDRHREIDWIHMWGENKEEYWFHPITHIILPQRGSLWSMPLCYWAMLCLIFGSRLNDGKFMILAGILTGLTPQVQVHSFVALVQWSISYCLMTFLYEIYCFYQKKKIELNNSKKINRIELNSFKLLSKIVYGLIIKYLKLWSIYGLISVAIALPQIGSFIGRIESSKDNFIQFNPIWNTPYQVGRLFRPVRLWWNGLGVFGAISIVFGWVSITKRQLFLYIPSLVVFLIANFIRYQPWELDNTKVFYACWIPFASPFVATFLSRLLFPFSLENRKNLIQKKLKNLIKSSSDEKPVKINKQNDPDHEGFLDRGKHAQKVGNDDNKENEREKEKEKMTKKIFINSEVDENLTLPSFLKTFLLFFIFVILLFSTIASSLIHLYQWYFFPCPIYEREDYLFGLWVAENTPINSVFLSHGYPQDPVGSVAGRQLHLGYPGWVSSHGLDYSYRWDKEHFILQHPEKRYLFEEEKIDYVVHFKYEKKNCEITDVSDVWQLVFDSDRYKVWKLKKY